MSASVPPPAVESADESAPSAVPPAQLPDTTAEAVVQPEAPNPDAPLAVDPAIAAGAAADHDSDSTFGSISSSGSTSVASSVRDYTYENGRRYHAFRQGEYLLPNDEAEQDRLDLQHHIFRLTLGGNLFRAPISTKPQRVLDMGTGTGIWAIEFADAFPSAEVIGTDLSPIQPTWVPPNCKFYVDDMESEWLFRDGEKFDYIHGRGLGGAITDWARLYQQAFENLKPGGWIEMQEFEGAVTSDDDPTLSNAPDLYRWQKLVDEAAVKIGKKFDVAHIHKQLLIDTGFEDVRDDIYKVPGGRWPQDRKLKELGTYQLEHFVDCVEPYTLAFFTRVLQWTTEDTQLLMAQVRKDFRNPENHLYAKFHFVYGRKPL